MATTNFREDWLGRDLVNPTGTALDYLGRTVTASTGYLGTPLRRIVRTNTTAVTTGQELQFVGEKFVVVTPGTTAASAPGAPAVGLTVADGSATLRRER
jgi:hypothetical protein